MSDRDWGKELCELELAGYKDDSFIGLGTRLFLELWNSDQRKPYGDARSILASTIPCKMVDRWLAE